MIFLKTTSQLSLTSVNSQSVKTSSVHNIHSEHKMLKFLQDDTNDKIFCVNVLVSLSKSSLLG